MIRMITFSPDIYYKVVIVKNNGVSGILVDVRQDVAENVLRTYFFVDVNGKILLRRNLPNALSSFNLAGLRLAYDPGGALYVENNPLLTVIK